MINFWLKSNFDDLKEMPLKNRLVMGMMSGYVDFYFAQEVIDIIVKRFEEENKGSLFIDDAPQDKKFQVRELQEQKNIGFNSYWSLRMIYETEFDDIEVAEEIAQKMAKETAYNLVTKYGWRKEN